MLQFSNIAVRRGPTLLFSNATFALPAGWRVGITGRNGSGKSSLLALISGELTPEAGDFSRPREWTLAHVRQETPALDSSALDYVLDGDSEWRAVDNALTLAEQDHDAQKQADLHERLASIDGYSARARASQLLHGLGFSDADFTRPVRSFSGGWRMRLNLATALMCRSDLLLLDEPTNHLDLDAVLWLETWLRRYPGTLLLISHDRDFLDSVVTHVLNITEGRIELFSGNVSGFERKRVERLMQQQSQLEKQQRQRTHLESFIERFRAKASKARQAQSRIKALERMAELAPMRAASPIQFEFRKPAGLFNPLVLLNQAVLGYGERRILESVTFRLAPGDRIALLGANGAGKSTLIKVLAGVVTPLAGERIEAKGLRIGYFAQHQLEQLDPNATPVEHLKRLDDSLGEQVARDFLGGFDFTGERALMVTAPFSGGEKARLCLALTVYQNPHLLLLDEPTNHLDLEMREALTEALQYFTGAMLLVSHDRALIRACCDELWVVQNGKVLPHDGDLDDYARRVTNATSMPPTANATPALPSRRDERRERAEQRARLTPLRQQINSLEKRLSHLAEQKRKVETQLAEPDLYNGSQTKRIAELTQHEHQILTDIAHAEELWLETHETLQQLSEASV